MPMPGAMQLRSARCQSTYWDNGDLRIVNYLTRRTFSANPIVLEVVRFFFSPRTIREAMLEFGSYARDSVGEAIFELIECQLLLESDSAESNRDELLDSSWKPWLPEGGFHFLTKDAPYVGGDWTIEQIMRTIPDTPSPPLFKKTEGAETVSLPFHEIETDSFYRTLHTRRTQRKFSEAEVPLESIAKLLRTTWGVQGYVETEEFGPLPLKTSPSAGARNPIEVYLMALRVKGLDVGLYHYDARDHALEIICGEDRKS